MNEEPNLYTRPPIIEIKIDLFKVVNLRKWWLKKQRERRAIRHARTQWYYMGCE